MLSIKSDPIQTEVFVIDAKTGEKKSIGKTPLELPANSVKDAGGEVVESGAYFPLIFEKEGYVPQKLLVPATRFGTLVTAIDVKLKQGTGPKEDHVAKTILDRLFLAQSLARNREFERAQIELDKVLTDSPNFARALSMKGSIYFVQKNYSESLNWYQKALSADPQMEEAVKMTARIRSLQGGSK